MKYILLGLLMGLYAFTPASSATLSELITDLRYRVDESDTSTSNFSDSVGKLWLNDAQDRIVALGGFIKKQTDITYSKDDTLGHVLPSDFRYVDQVIYLDGRQWETVINNPGFFHDTSTNQFTIKWQNADTARIYFKGTNFWEDKRVRLFYLGVADGMTADSTECEAQDDVEGFIVEEAFVYYLQSLKMYQAAQVVRQNIREDMGLIKQVKGQ